MTRLQERAAVVKTGPAEDPTNGGNANLLEVDTSLHCSVCDEMIPAHAHKHHVDRCLKEFLRKNPVHGRF